MMVRPSVELPVRGERPEIAFRLEELLQQREGDRADHRAAQAADAAEDEHQQHRAGLVPRQQLGIDGAVLHRQQQARQAGERAGDDEGGELVAA